MSAERKTGRRDSIISFTKTLIEICRGNDYLENHLSPEQVVSLLEHFYGPDVPGVRVCPERLYTIAMEKAEGIKVHGHLLRMRQRCGVLLTCAQSANSIDPSVYYEYHGPAQFRLRMENLGQRPRKFIRGITYEAFDRYPCGEWRPPSSSAKLL